MNMKPIRFQQLVKECIKEVLNEAGRRICSWCKKDMGPLSFGSPHDSHGICPECYTNIKAMIDRGDFGPKPPNLPPIQSTQTQ